MLLRIISIMFLSLGITVSQLSAAEKTSTTDSQLTMASQKTEEVRNQICPVSGDKIKKGEEAKFEYEGKAYNFCCKMCIKDFKKDPKKFLKNLEKTSK